MAGLPPPPSALPTPHVTHRGELYMLGFVPGAFAIWRFEGAPPIETFEWTSTGWERAWRRFQELERDEVVPAWRRPRAGWILLHIVIGIVLWFVVLFVEGMVLGATDRDLDVVTDTAGTGMVVALPLSVSAWILFVYLRSRRAGSWSFVALLALALVVAIWTGVAGQPVV